MSGEKKKKFQAGKVEEIKHLIPTAGGWSEGGLSLGQGEAVNEVESSSDFTGLSILQN